MLLLSGALALLPGCAMVDHWTGEDVNRVVRERGVPAEARVLEIWDTGVRLNDHPVVGFRLEVEAAGRSPWQAETRAVVSILAIPRIQPGSVLAVKYDPADPSRVAIVARDEASQTTAPPLPVPVPDGDLGDDLRVERLADGVWLHTSYHELAGFGRVPANGLVVVGDGEAALIDTPWTDEQTERLLAWVSGTLGVEVRVVVPTHSHQDCMGGLAAAHAAGARSFALELTAELAAEAALPAPMVVFSDHLRLRLGSRSLLVRHLGAGHTRDNIVVFLAEDRILFGGCLVRSARATRLGYTGEADLEAWPRTIERLLEEYGDAALVVPGHGDPGGVELLENTLALVRAATAGSTSSSPPRRSQ
jgi:metallo-beta-lactamase class B